MKYGFIGCGNMGGAIARALSNSTKEILLADLAEQKAKDLANELGISYGTNEEAVNYCDVLFLAIKPQMAESVLGSLKDQIMAKRPILISMLAGVQSIKIQVLAGDPSIPVIRILPNTPVAVGKGLIIYHASEQVPEDALQQILADLAPAGTLDELDEKLIDAGGTLSGCGPAYMYMFLNALADGAVACGLPRDKALLYAKLTMAGSAELALKSGKHPEQLKDEVCSPGGTTIQGVKALEEGGFRDAAISAILAAYEKTRKIG
ncbi:MAG: pyrroline-5-carboxylate reductase [Lachnospiraceae bacterium]|nr:pyrroline-5-carboxylate reductase [Lachnospiraceae bacterium]